MEKSNVGLAANNGAARTNRAIDFIYVNRPGTRFRWPDLSPDRRPSGHPPSGPRSLGLLPHLSVLRTACRLAPWRHAVATGRQESFAQSFRRYGNSRRAKFQLRFRPSGLPLKLGPIFADRSL